MSDIRLPPSEPVLAELIANLPREAALTVRQLAYQRDRYMEASALLDQVRSECSVSFTPAENGPLEWSAAEILVSGPPDLLLQFAERLKRD